jgi:hypothetical protein
MYGHGILNNRERTINFQKPCEKKMMFDMTGHPYLVFPAHTYQNLCRQLYVTQNLYKRYVDNNLAMSANKVRYFMQGIIYFFQYKGECFYYAFR